MRLVLALALLLAAVAAPLTAATADEDHRRGHRSSDPAFSGPGWKFREMDRFRDHFRDHDHHHHYRRCWQPGYWTYQWVPAPGWYGGGYYQQVWVDGYWRRC